MPWLKNVVVDLLIPVLIVLAVLFGQTWAAWIVWIYTPVMVLMKAIAFFGGGFVNQFKGRADAPPDLFFHVLYGLNLALLLYARWGWTAAGWAVIWALSVAAERRARPAR